MPSQAAQATPTQAPMHDTPPSGLIDIAEAASQANRSVDQIRRLVRDGRLPRAKKLETPVGRKWFIDPEELAAYYGRLGVVADLPMQEPRHDASVAPMQSPSTRNADSVANENDVPMQTPRRDAYAQDAVGGGGFFDYLHTENKHLKDELKEERKRIAELQEHKGKLEAELGEQRGRAEEREKTVRWLQEQFPELMKRAALPAGTVEQVSRGGEGIASTLRPEDEISVETTPTTTPATSKKQGIRPMVAATSIAITVLIIAAIMWWAANQQLF